jgi:hypothetical protein
MANTPLYSYLKQNGTSFYAFPGGGDDLSSVYQNINKKMYFSKFMLINLPKQNLVNGTNSNPIHFDFYNSDIFKEYSGAQQATNFNDQFVESLRNYVANMETTMRTALMNNSKDFYDTTNLHTPTERIFWKWLKELNIISFEPADTGTQYFDNMPEFGSNLPSDPEYLPEILWTERTTNPFTVTSVQGILYNFDNVMSVIIKTDLNCYLRVGDLINFTGFVNNTTIGGFTIASLLNGVNTKIQDIVNNEDGTYTITTSISVANATSAYITGLGTLSLVYSRVIQYVGEIQGVNNVQQANGSYTEVYANIPDYVGQTPDILFRTTYDNNYLPGYSYPILPSQYQAEIVGAEIFSNPIVSNPQNYPGSYYGQFDTVDYTYTTENGDTLRRTGDYFGINGNINDTTLTYNIDGISFDFDPTHYTKMNIIGQEITSFEMFSGLIFDNMPPQDFEFNAILWFYDVEDNNGNIATNLYGISLIDNPENNTKIGETNVRFPLLNKLCTTDNQDGTSYAFSLNLNFSILNDNVQDLANPDAINSLFSFSLFNNAMTQLSITNDAFIKIVNDNVIIQQEINNLKQLIYTNTSLKTINDNISYLQKLIQLYQYNQIIDSDTIYVTSDTSKNPPSITLNTQDPLYSQINNINTTSLYNNSDIVVSDINIPNGRSFLINVINNDTLDNKLNNNQNLGILISSDLRYGQKFDLIIDSNLTSTQNKKLDLMINYVDSSNNIVTDYLIKNIDLPVYYNSFQNKQNSANLFNKFNFTIDYSNIILTPDNKLKIGITGSSNILSNSIKKGDYLVLNDFVVGSASNIIDYSGQYFVIDPVSSNYIWLDVSTNSDLVNSVYKTNTEYNFSSVLYTLPYITYNKGLKYTITRIDSTNTSSLSSRYLIEKSIN